MLGGKAACNCCLGPATPCNCLSNQPSASSRDGCPAGTRPQKGQASPLKPFDGFVKPASRSAAPECARSKAQRRQLLVEPLVDGHDARAPIAEREPGNRSGIDVEAEHVVERQIEIAGDESANDVAMADAG